MNDVDKLKQYNTVLDLVSQIRHIMLQDWHVASIVHCLDMLEAVVFREMKRVEADVQASAKKW